MKAFALQDRPPSSPPAEHNEPFRVVRRFRAWRRVGIVIDAFAILAAAAIAVFLEWHDPLGAPARFWRYGSVSQVPAWKLGTAFLSFVVVLLWTSSHHRDSAFRKRSLLEEQRLNLQDCAVSAVFLAGVLYLLGADAVSHALVLWLLVWATVGLALRRLIFRAFAPTYTGSRNVLIIGTDSAACTLREQLRDGAGAAYVFKAFVKLFDGELDCTADRSEVVGTLDKLPEHVYRCSANEVLLTGSCDREMALKIMHQAHELGIDARMVLGRLRFGVKQKS